MNGWGLSRGKDGRGCLAFNASSLFVLSERAEKILMIKPSPRSKGKSTNHIKQNPTVYSPESGTLMESTVVDSNMTGRTHSKGKKQSLCVARPPLLCDCFALNVCVTLTL